MCFNRPRSLPSDFFFGTVDQNFVGYWESFFEMSEDKNLGSVLMNYELSLGQLDNENLSIPYDYDLFGSYSGYPMEIVSSSYKSCQSYFGDFFYKRFAPVFYFDLKENY